MKQLPLIATALYCEPWCIRPEIHSDLSRQFRDYQKSGGVTVSRAGGFNATSGAESEAETELEIVGNIALIEISGVIGKYLSTLEMMCGGFDLQTLTHQLALVKNDPSIETLIITFNTPGGRVTGVEAAADAIRAVSESGKRVIAYTDSTCASAGYWLASACDEIYAEGSATVGSISTISAAIDASRAWEMEGMELKLFTTGALKAIGMEGKRWTPEEEKFMMDRVNAIDGDFKGYISQRRGLSPDLMNGAFWYAKHAPAGVIDGLVADLNELLTLVMLAR